MFETLSDRLSGVFGSLTRQGALSDEDIATALREVRTALLEADVSLPVARDFVKKVADKAKGQAVTKSVTPGQQVVKIVHDALIDMLRGEGEPGHLRIDSPPAPILMVGLQGSGKTTTTAKLARRLKEREGKRVLMASLDTRRPAAMEQLAILGAQVGVDTLPIVPGQDPVAIAKRARQQATLGGYDVVMLDTAGRLHIDDELMAEVAAVRDATKPHETLLVVDGLTGQDAVNVATEFDGPRRRLRRHPHPHGRRRPRRRRALHARSHRQADQVRRPRREARRAGGVPPRPHRRPHPRHGRHRRPGREGAGDPRGSRPPSG